MDPLTSEQAPTVKPIYARLADTPVTQEARALVDAVMVLVAGQEAIEGKRKNQRRGESAAKFETMVAAFLADLLRAAGKPDTGQWVYRSLQHGTFSAQAGLSRSDFKHALSALRALTLVERVEGGPWGFQGLHTDDTDDAIETEGVGSAKEKRKASHFRATNKLVALSREHGVEPADIGGHFLQDLPREPVVLHSAKTKSGKREVRGKPVIIRPGSALEHLLPAVHAMNADLRRLNTFLAGFKLEGGSFRGHRRIFNHADQDGFALNKGARFYANGDPSYQAMSKDARKAMTIDGEEVVEMDVKASYLTILHGRQNLPFDAESQDPYEVETLPLRRDAKGKDFRRWAVKNWVVATLGAKRHHREWPWETVQEYERRGGDDLESDYPIKAVREAMVEKFPVLKEWGTNKLGMTWADLMFIESEAMFMTMMEMMDEHSAPSFSVHDSIIVRQRDASMAKDILRKHYASRCGLSPVID